MSSQPASSLDALRPQPWWSRRLKALLAGKEAARILKFLVVGIMAFGVDVGALSVFALWFHIDPTVAKGLAFVIAVLASFAGNYFWTYRDSRSKPLATQLFQFGCVSIAGLVINLLVFHAAHSVALKLWNAVVALYVGEFVAVCASLVWNFLANRFITYNDVR
jgi:putative flippase GtrA